MKSEWTGNAFWDLEFNVCQHEMGVFLKMIKKKRLTKVQTEKKKLLNVQVGFTIGYFFLLEKGREVKKKQKKKQVVFL